MFFTSFMCFYLSLSSFRDAECQEPYVNKPGIVVIDELLTTITPVVHWFIKKEGANFTDNMKAVFRPSLITLLALRAVHVFMALRNYDSHAQNLTAYIGFVACGMTAILQNNVKEGILEHGIRYDAVAGSPKGDIFNTHVSYMSSNGIRSHFLNHNEEVQKWFTSRNITPMKALTPDGVIGYLTTILVDIENKSTKNDKDGIINQTIRASRILAHADRMVMLHFNEYRFRLIVGEVANRMNNVANGRWKGKVLVGSTWTKGDNFDLTKYSSDKAAVEEQHQYGGEDGRELLMTNTYGITDEYLVDVSSSDRFQAKTLIVWHSQGFSSSCVTFFLNMLKRSQVSIAHCSQLAFGFTSLSRTMGDSCVTALNMLK